MDEETLKQVEDLALELARLAGLEIAGGLARSVEVKYKSASRSGDRDPVSEVDLAVERMVRERVADEFAGHAVIGEEHPEATGREERLVWVVDPIDGTTNFVHGFPLIAASLGVLEDGVPRAGAVWCSASHELRPGVYHTSQGELRYDGAALNPRRRTAGSRRSLLGDPRAAPTPAWDVRITGSAAIECALVAAGVMEASRLVRPSIWDVAGGVALVRAGGGQVWEAEDGGWRRFERFRPSADGDSLRTWRGSLLVTAAGAGIRPSDVPTA